MTMDAITAAGLVAREVHSGSRDGMPTKIAVARRTYATDRADLWDAVTNPDRLPRWFLPVTGDLGVGGRYQVQGNAGGVVEGCTPPESFSLTWEMGPMVSWLHVTITDAADGAQLELRHEAPVDPQFWEQFGPGAVGVGWDGALRGLGLHLATGESLDPVAVEAWTMSPEGVAFVREAAAAWSAAAVADGFDPEAAQAATEATVAFYTTKPEADS